MYTLLLSFLLSFASGSLLSSSTQARSYRSKKLRKHRRYRRKKRRQKRTIATKTAQVQPSRNTKVETLAEMRKRVLLIATKPSPPFSMKTTSGQWNGISIALWKEIARELKLKYKFVELPLKQMLEATKNKKVDAAVASLTITPEREQVLDFTHPFYSTGLGIAVNASSGGGSVLYKLLSWEYLKFFVFLLLLLFGTGILIWFFERKANPEEFGGTAAHGIGAGFWWSVVTMTTVGYGDKSPRSFFGRALGIIWIFAGLLLVSSFTATLTTLQTLAQLESKIKGPQDLYKLRVATVGKSTSMRYLRKRKISATAYKNVFDGMRAVADKKVDAMVYDAPLLRYIANQQLQGVTKVIPGNFERQDYGIALPAGSALREPVNRVLLRYIYSQEWKSLTSRYLGK